MKITPQKAALNQGPWKKIEDAVRRYIRDREKANLYILTGPLYNRTMQKLPKTTKDHKVPSGYWKIIAEKIDNEIRIVSFIFDQETQRRESPLLHLTTVDEVEELSGLDFFIGISNEDSLESSKNKIYNGLNI